MKTQSSVVTKVDKEERINKCSKDGLCFVSLRPLEKDAIEVNGIKVNSKYLRAKAN